MTVIKKKKIEDEKEEIILESEDKFRNEGDVTKVVVLGKRMAKEFKCIGKIGDGAFSQVFHCVSKLNKEHVAVKEYVFLILRIFRIICMRYMKQRIRIST